MSSSSPRTAALAGTLAALVLLLVAPAGASASFANDFSVEVACVEEASETTYVATFHWISAHDVEMTQTGANNTVLSGGSPGPPPTVFAANAEGDWVTAPVLKTQTVRWQLGGATATAGWKSSPRCYEAPSAIGTPAIAGDFVVGGTIRAIEPEFRTSAGSWDVAYHWWIGCETAQSGEVVSTDEPTFTLRPQDVGRAVKVFVQVVEPYPTGAAANAESACDTSRRVGTAPANTEVPSIAGAAKLGSTLSLAGGAWTGSAPLVPSIRWEACTTTACATVGTAPTYEPAPADVGKTIRAAVLNANAFGALTVVTAPTAPVAEPVAASVAGGGGLQSPLRPEAPEPEEETPAPPPPPPPPPSSLKSTPPSQSTTCVGRADELTYRLRRMGFAGQPRVTVWRGDRRIATDAEVDDRVATLDLTALPPGKYRVVIKGHDDEGDPLKVERTVRLCPAP